MFTTISQSPALRSPISPLITALIAAIPVAAMLYPLIPGEGSATGLVAYLVAAVLCAVVIVAAYAARYRRLAVDFGAGVVRMGARTVPLASITSAERSLWRGRGGVFITYRLRSELGPAVRVRVAGSPVRGLDETRLRSLRRLLALAPIAVPADGLVDRQRVVAAQLLESPRLVRVGAASLLDELDGLIAGSHTTTAAATVRQPVDASPSGSPGSPASLEPRSDAPVQVPPSDLIALWAHDDADAARAIAGLPAGPTVMARVVLATIAVAFLLFVAAVAGPAVVRSATGAWIDPGAESAAVLITLALLFGAWVAWVIVEDVRTSQARAAARAWLAADPVRAQRGLAAPFLGSFASAATRTLAFGSVLGLLVGAFMFAVGCIVFGEADGSIAVVVAGVVVVVLSLGAVALGIIGLVVVRRRARAAAGEAVVAAGPRLGAPQQVVVRP